MKKYFQIIGITALICFSFFFTEKTSFVIKNSDEIMQKINEEKDKYKKEPINPIIKDNTIIPGINGKIINVEESYKKMKRIGSYNSSLFVYDDLKPEISIKDNYDKFIISGNKNNMNIYIIFKINDELFMEELIKTLDKNKINSSFLYEENNEKIYNKLKNLKQNDILLSENNLNLKFKSNIYCYNYERNIEFLQKCSNKKYFSISPNLSIKNDLYSTIKLNLKSGLIITVEINKNTLYELEHTISYTKSKGYEIENITKLLNE